MNPERKRSIQLKARGLSCVHFRGIVCSLVYRALLLQAVICIVPALELNIGNGVSSGFGSGSGIGSGDSAGSGSVISPTTSPASNGNGQGTCN